MSLVKRKEKMLPLWCNRIIHQSINNYSRGGRNTDGGDKFGWQEVTRGNYLLGNIERQISYSDNESAALWIYTGDRDKMRKPNLNSSLKPFRL